VSGSLWWFERLSKTIRIGKLQCLSSIWVEWCPSNLYLPNGKLKNSSHRSKREFYRPLRRSCSQEIARQAPL
jgi:hypothetical protein